LRTVLSLTRDHLSLSCKASKVARNARQVGHTTGIQLGVVGKWYRTVSNRYASTYKHATDQSRAEQVQPYSKVNYLACNFNSNWK